MSEPMNISVRASYTRSCVVLSLLCLLAFPTGAATTNVSYGSFFFNPKVVSIKVGDTVNWTGSAGHTLLGTGSDPICGGGSLPCSHTFNTAGNFAYECTVPGHAGAGMTGLVVVASAVLPPPLPATLTNAMRLSNGQFRFTVVTTTNRTNIIQASTNLTGPTSWVGINTNVPTTSTFTFTDSNAPALKLRFYRVVEPP
jgi:plastocyanin